MNSVLGIKDCYGCGVCSLACSKKIIDICLGDSGFYEPYIIDESKCVHCGLCVKVCSYLHPDLSLKSSIVKSYAAWSNDEVVRKKCSSGGVGFEIGKHLLGSGYKACGARYGVGKCRVEHFVAKNVEEYLSSVGSKYLQSYTIDAFRKIDESEKNLVIGTPCQIDSFRRYLQKKKVERNFILIDFFCHGVPSMNLWIKYLSKIEREVGKVINVAWRDKSAGWHSSYNIQVKGVNGYYNSKFKKDNIFYEFFLSNTCLGKACYEKCKYKYIYSSADIRIGDLWGKKYESDNKGVSGVLVFTERGFSVVESLSSCTVEEQSLEIVTNGQMKERVKRPFLRFFVIKMLKYGCGSLSSVAILVYIQLFLKAFRFKLIKLKNYIYKSDL